MSYGITGTEWTRSRPGQGDEADPVPAISAPRIGSWPEALNDRNRRALLALETNARRRSEETGELVILALFE